MSLLQSSRKSLETILAARGKDKVSPASGEFGRECDANAGTCSGH